MIREINIYWLIDLNLWYISFGNEQLVWINRLILRISKNVRLENRAR